MPPYPLHRQISIFLSPSFARSLRAKTIDVYVSSQNITKNRTSIVFVHERSKIKRMEKRALEFVYLQEIGFCNFDLGYVYFCILFPFASQKLLQIRPSRLSRLYIDRYVRAQRGQSFDRSRTSWTGATFLSLHPFQSNSQVLATRISLDRVHFAPIDAAIPIHPITGINPSWDQTSSLLLRLRLGESIHNFFQPNSFRDPSFFPIIAVIELVHKFEFRYLQRLRDTYPLASHIYSSFQFRRVLLLESIRRSIEHFS